MALGSVFLELRRSRGLTQRRLAWRSGLSQPTISRLETGKAPWLSAVQIARLLAGLDLDRDELGFKPKLAPSQDAGWRLLMERFDAARRRRELRTLAETAREAREQALRDFALRLKAPTPRPPP